MRAVLLLGPLAVVALLGSVNLGCNKRPLDRDGKPITKGTFRVRTFPTGAKVWINGKLEVRATPATLVLKAGRHRLRIQHPGAEAVEKDIEVEAGRHDDATFNIPKPPDATVSVISDVIGASVRINGYVRGRTPIAAKTTRPGPLDITVTTPDGRARSVQDNLHIAEQKRIEVIFGQVTSGLDQEIQSTPKGFGTLTLGTFPNAEVFDADDKKIGETPLQAKRMPAGEHHLLLRTKDRKYKRRVTVEIEAGQRATFRFRLKKSEGK